MNDEEWESVVGFENSYRVSNLGRILSSRFDRLMAPTPDKDGYLKVGLSKDGKQKWLRVHRVVFEAFHGPIDEGLVIDHKDNNPRNNALANLEAVTHLENHRRSGRRDGVGSGYRLSEDAVRRIRTAYRLGGTTQLDLAVSYGVSQSVISEVVNMNYYKGVK